MRLIKARCVFRIAQKKREKKEKKENNLSYFLNCNPHYNGPARKSPLIQIRIYHSESKQAQIGETFYINAQDVS